jgi:Bacterial protein of unknown function (DUF899)
VKSGWQRGSSCSRRRRRLTRRSDEPARRRQRLPWVRVDKEYRFETDEGSASLAGVFRGRSQPLVYHFMFGPDYTSLLRRLGAALRRQRGGNHRLVRVHVGDGRDADVRRLDDVDGVDADARTDDRSWLYPALPAGYGPGLLQGGLRPSGSSMSALPWFRRLHPQQQAWRPGGLEDST